MVLFCLTYGYPISPAFFVQKLSFLYKFFAPLSEIICAHLCGSISWFSKWQSTPTLLPGKSHGRRSLIGYSPWGPKNRTLSDFTFTFTFIPPPRLLHSFDYCGYKYSNHFLPFYSFFFSKFFYSNYFAFTYKIKIIILYL